MLDFLARISELNKKKQPDVVSTEYLWYCLLMDKCQKNIDMDSFYKVEYPCPTSRAIQDEIVARPEPNTRRGAEGGRGHVMDA